MWQSEPVADGLAFCICYMQTVGFVLLSPGEDRAFLLASRFLSVGATKKNICGMQGRERERERERRGNKLMTKELANTISPKCSSSFACCALFTVKGKHVDTSEPSPASFTSFRLLAAS